VSETLRILELLQEGEITAEEATRLLEALKDTPPAGSPQAVSLPAVRPNMQRFRYFAYIPFGISLVALLLAGWGTLALSRQPDGRITAGYVMLVILLVLLFFTTLLAFAMTRVPWLHVRIQERSEDEQGEPSWKRLAFSLPVPLSLAQWGLRIARRFVGEEHAAQLETAAALLRSSAGELGKPGGEPIIVEVEDENEHVQVYIG
jgi:hypothetical protein